MRELVTTALDVIALVAVAVGCGWWIGQEVSWPAGLVTGGIILGLVSAIAAAQDEKAAAAEKAAKDATLAPRGGSA